MCLLKVYLEEDSEKKLIASDITLIYKEGNAVTLKGIELQTVVSLEHVDMKSIDTLNSVLILKSTK
jgi:hypothetical protein